MTTALGEASKLDEITDLIAEGGALSVALARALWVQVAAQWSAFSDEERAAAPELRDRWRRIGERMSWC